MSRYRVPFFLAGVFLAIALAGVARTLPAIAQQSPAPSSELPVALVLVPKLDRDDARAVLIRRSEALPPDVILVTAATRPADLVEAVRLLYGSRARLGMELTRDLMAYVAPARPETERSRNIGFAQRELARLRRAEPFDVEGIGRYPLVLSYMNPPATR